VTGSQAGGPPLELRAGGPADLPQLCVLATHVFVATYCTGGLRPDQAREALSAYSLAAFAQQLAEGHRFTLALRGEHLLGFADTVRTPAPPLPALAGALELARLYVEPAMQRQGLGLVLLRSAEDEARRGGHAGLWLTAWAGNTRALAFYAAAGYADLGRRDHVFEGRAYENRVMFKALAAGAAGA
jgi:GNAT superfamily N-acetyltransferase